MELGPEARQGLTTPTDSSRNEAVVSIRENGAPGRARSIVCLGLLFAAVQLVAGPKFQLSQWQASADGNAGIAEGEAWKRGRLDLPPVVNGQLDWSYPKASGELGRRLHDTAYVPEQGRIYNVFPPLAAILTVVTSPLHRFLGFPDGFWPAATLVYLAYVPLVVTGFVVFLRRLKDPVWAAVLTLGWICGSAVLPNLHAAQGGQLGQTYHVVSQIGLLILAADVLGRQRIWPGLIGLLISTYTRQLTCLYGIVLLWMAYRRHGTRGALLCVSGMAVIAAPLCLLNYMKFGSPLDFGYRFIYTGRETEKLAQDCMNHGTFSPWFIPTNFYYQHLALPRLDDVSLTGVNFSEDNPYGTSMWFTTPMAVWALVSARQWWRQREARWLMLGTLPVMLGLLCYHSPGYLELGYNRFALDFLPIWLLVSAPFTRGGRRTWLSVVLIAWSLIYFQSMVPDTPVAQRLGRRVMATQGVLNGKV